MIENLPYSDPNLPYSDLFLLFEYPKCIFAIPLIKVDDLTDKSIIHYLLGGSP